MLPDPNIMSQSPILQILWATKVNYIQILHSQNIGYLEIKLNHIN